MRILVLIYEYPPVGGGGGMVAQDLSQGFARRGHDVRVLTAHYGDLPHEEDRQGVRIYRVDSLRRSPYRAGLGAMAGYLAAGWAAAQRLVRAERPDLVHVHFAVPTGPLAWALEKQYRLPYVLTAHLGDVPGGVPEKTAGWFRWLDPLTPPIWKRARRVAAVSEFTRQLAHQHYGVEVETILNGVDLSDLDPGEIRLGSPPRILFAGRFMDQKNPLQLVRSLNEVRHLPWQCSMLGDGPLLEATRAEAAALGLAERFEFPGWVSPEAVIDGFRRSDILFMPSLSEGLPVVGVRAIAMGLAVVASDIGGFKDLVQPGVNGSLTPLSAPQDYARALSRLLSDPALLLRSRQASRQHAQRFDLENVVDAYERLFEQALEDERRRP